MSILIANAVLDEETTANEMIPIRNLTVFFLNAFIVDLLLLN
jgi:hypothetical protein